MSGLTPEAKELLREGRAALRPTDADRARVLEALLPQLGAGGAAAGAKAPALWASTAKAGWIKFSVAVIGLGILGGGLFLAAGPGGERAPAIVPLPAAVPTTEPLPQATVTGAAAPLPVAPKVAEADERKAAPPRVADRLAQEVAILSRAGTELHSGRAAAALRALDEHQKKFPAGLLTQERTAARIQALCALGRMTEADAELARLARSSPESPHEARARQACGSRLKRKK